MPSITLRMSSSEGERLLNDPATLHALFMGYRDEDPEKAEGLKLSGDQFVKIFEITGEDEDICQAITAYENAVACLSSDDPRLARFLTVSCDGYYRRYSRFGHLDDLEKLANATRIAVELTEDGDAEYPVYLSRLATVLSTQFDRIGNMVDISEAIQLHQRAIQLASRGDARLPFWLNNLGSSFAHRFERTRDLEDNSQAIQNRRKAIELTRDGDSDLPIFLGNLGGSLCSRFQAIGGLDNLDGAIQNLQLAIQLTPEERPELPTHLGNLGSSLLRRFEHTGNLADVYEAIRNYKRAIQLTPNGHPDLPFLLNNLGNSFCRRFEHTKVMEDISEAISKLQHAIQITPVEDTALPGLLNNLGHAFTCRFQHTKDMKDISEAIIKIKLAVDLTAEGHANLPTWVENLGTSYMHRFDCIGDMKDITAAIQNLHRAVRLTAKGNANLPSRLDNLGVALGSRFQGSIDPRIEDISEAIQHQEHAILLTEDGHPHLAVFYYHLGESYHDASRFEREFTSRAIANYRLAATNFSGRPSIRLNAAKKWASLAQKNQQYVSSSELLEGYACVVQLLSLNSGLENTVQRRHEILIDSSKLTIASSAAALSLGYPDKALEWLVEGRCIVWNQINQLRTPLDELRSHDAALAERLSHLSSRLENAGLRADSCVRGTRLSADDRLGVPLDSEDEAREHVVLAKEWEQLLATIRNIPGFEDFLQPKKCADIMRRLPDDGVVVIINMHNLRCDALALMASRNDPLHIPLQKFSYQKAEQLVQNLRGYLLSCNVRSRGDSRVGIPLADDSVSDIDLPNVLEVLWSDVVNPILKELAFSVPGSSRTLPRIWWCPTGPLAFLPIHAAGIYSQGTSGQSVSEFAVSSYIPTVSIFETCGKRHVEPTGLLMVSQPDTPGMGTIPFAREEVLKVQNQLAREIPRSTLNHEQGTVHHFLESMERFSCVHLACHASQDMANPLHSAIYLHDRPLKLSEIIEKNLRNADFAFLSACQTGQGDKNLPEEAVHIASGMLAAGYQSVVGTMWSIFDIHGPDVAECFYKHLMGNTATGEGEKIINGGGAARALHHATQHLREKVSSSDESFLAWVPYIHIGI